VNTSVLINNQSISLQLNLHAIKIFNSDALSSILAQNTEATTQKLVDSVKTEYLKLFNVDFDVSDNSMAVEIWAHIYAEKFAEAVKNFSSISFVDKIAEKIMQHTEVIDIGERGHDDNRFVWDGLAVFKSAIAGLLFSK
jgi:hypothetical protein